MKVNTIPSRTPIEFEKIYQGTIFKNNRRFFLKCNGGAAADIESGEIVYPANDADGGWNQCFIYPRASLDIK